MEAWELVDFNPWWSSGSVPTRLLEEKHRAMYGELEKLLRERQMISIVGLRRTGKTSLMYQLMDHLLKQDVPKERILYFSFDRKVHSLNDIVKTYKREILMEDTLKEQTYFFLDEIQKLDGWEDQIKILYDKRLPLKIVISGSSSLSLDSGSKETLAGRIYAKKLSPLSFREYLDLAGISIPEFTDLEETYRKIEINKEKLIAQFTRFVRYHGLPETIGMNEELAIMYTRSSLIDQVIYKDIPSNYKLEDPGILEELLRIIAERPGMLLRLEGMASDLSRTRQTISNYIFYLENAFLLYLAYNYSSSFITSAKKLKKVYFSHPSISYTLNPSKQNLGMLVENQIVNELDARFFHRRRQKEVDIILRYNNSIIPIEVKFKNNLRDDDEKTLRDFLDKEGLENGLLVTKNHFDICGMIKVPAFFFLLYKEDILKVSSNR